MRVLVVQDNQTVKVEDRPIPQLKSNEVLLRTLCVGANPIDFKHLLMVSKPGDWLGCDYVGEVVDIGPSVPKDQVKIGEIRWNFMRGGIGQRGAFAEYITSEWDLTSLLPSNVTPQQAASFPIPLLTAVQAFYLPSNLNFPEPPDFGHPERRPWILIWAGSTAVGQFAVQLAKLSGLNVATTASPKKWDLLKSYGADVVVDYNDPNVVEKLKTQTNDSIRYGLDCITEGGSTKKAQLAFGPQGGDLITTQFDHKDLPRPEVKTRAAMVFTMLGEEQFWRSTTFQPHPQDRDLHVRWAKKITDLVANGQIKPLDVHLCGGLENIQKGLDELRQGKHQGKLVYNVSV